MRRYKAWDGARNEYFDSTLPGCCSIGLHDGIVAASASFDGAGYSCIVCYTDGHEDSEGKTLWTEDKVRCEVAVVTHVLRNGGKSYSLQSAVFHTTGTVTHDHDWHIALDENPVYRTANEITTLRAGGYRGTGRFELTEKTMCAVPLRSARGVVKIGDLRGLYEDMEAPDA